MAKQQQKILLMLLIITLSAVISLAAANDNQSARSMHQSEQQKLTVVGNNSKYILSERKQFLWDYEKDQYSISFDLSSQNEEQINKNENQLSQILLFQILIDSPYEYKIYLIPQDNLQTLLKFNNLDSYHYLQHSLLTKSSRFQILFIRVSEEDEEEEDSEDQFENEEIEQLRQEFYSINIIQQNEKKSCPFNCHSRGICQEDGTCKCYADYSKDYNCQINIKEINVEIDTQQKVQLLQDNKNVKYISIEIESMQELQQQIIQRQQLNEQLNNILITFTYNRTSPVKGDNSELLGVFDGSSQEDSQNSIAILDNHNYFKCLTTAKIPSLEGDKYSASYSISNIALNRIMMSSAFKLILKIEGDDIKDMRIQVQMQYVEYDMFTETFQLLLTLTFTIVILAVIISFCKTQHTNNFTILPLSQIILPLSQTSPTKLSAQDLSNMINQQIPIYSQQQQTLEPINTMNTTHSDCPICLSTYEITDVLCKTKCGHVFHKLCLDAWLERHLVCPVDRILLLNSQ